MAKAEKDKEKGEQPKADDKAPAAAPKKMPLKVVAVVAGIMLAEAAGVVLLVGMMSRPPQEAAAEVHGEDHNELEGTVEIELVDDRFQNMQSGRVWSWEIAVFLKVKKKNEEFVMAQLEERAAEIKEGVSQIIRRAQHIHLKEPDLTTLNRQVRAFLDKALGTDPEGDSRIERVMIPKCKGIQLEA